MVLPLVATLPQFIYKIKGDRGEGFESHKPGG